MTDRLTHTELQALARQEQSHCVSIYLPTHRAGREVAQDPIRLRNLLRSAKADFGEKREEAALADTILEPVRNLAADSSFWRQQLDSLALFATEGTTRTFRLPVMLDEAVHVTTRYHLTPLIAYLNREPHFYVLALSVNQVRLLKGTAFGVEEVSCPVLPGSMAEVVPEEEPDSQLQLHSGGRHSAVFHGQGGGEEASGERLSRFFCACDRAVAAFLRSETAPLFLACVDHHFAAYKRINSYPHLMDTPLPGSTAVTSDQEYLDKCAGLLEKRFEQQERAAATGYMPAKSVARASDKLPEILAAAGEGRVDSLWIPRGRQVPGVWQADLHQIQPQATDGRPYDLLDYVGVQTYLTGGQVFVVPPELMPDQGPAAAIFRF